MLGMVAGLVAAIGAETALAVLQTRVLISGSQDWRLGCACRFVGIAALRRMAWFTSS